MLNTLEACLKAVDEILLGKDRQVRLALACLLARGHLLIEDLPGMGKTTLSHALARVLGLSFQRIQFTSDLLPGDILGTSVFDKDSGQFVFHPGPIFAELVLADEINRATPKSQSALLEAMEEGQVTIEGATRPLPEPFFVIATQNPASQGGTFSLPESQLDRFLMRLSLGYPGRAAERSLLLGEARRDLLPRLEPLLDHAALAAFQAEVPKVRASDALAATPIEVDRQQAIRTALQQQPEYLQRLIGSRQADLNLVLAKNQRLWDVSLVGGASQIRDRYSEGGGDNSRSWDSYAGVQVEIPIGDLSRRQAEVRAQVDVENQKILIEDARQTLEQNVIDAVRDLGTRWRQYQIAQRATALSRRKLEIEREKLRVGRSSNFQVLSFETDLRNVENTQLNALISFLNAQTQLDLIVGMTLDSWEISLNDH